MGFRSQYVGSWSVEAEAAVVASSVAELPLRNWNDSGIIPHFRDPGMEWEWNFGNTWRNGMGMELRAFLPGMEWEWNYRYFYKNKALFLLRVVVPNYAKIRTHQPKFKQKGAPKVSFRGRLYCLALHVFFFSLFRHLVVGS